MVSTSVSGSTITYTLGNAQGGTSSYKVTTATINANTNFGQPNVGECITSGTTSCPMTVVRSIQLPDNTTYSFQYDCDKTVDSTDCSTAGGQSAYYGLLTSMTLPTGGQITYSWNPYTDSQGNHYQWISKRTTPDSSTGWTYTPLVVNTCGSGQVNCQQTFTVVKPSGDATKYTFALNGGAWQNQVQTYTGSTSGTLLSTVSACWNFVTISQGVCQYNTTTGAAATGVQKYAESTTLPVPGGTTITKTTQYTYDSYGNTIKIQENNYYTGNLPSTVDRTTSISYLNTTAYLNALILNRPTSVTVTNSGGGTIAQTNYFYDQTAPTSVTGVVNHDDTNYGTGNNVRGNLTQVQRLISGTSNYLNTYLTYDMTGQVLTSKDSNGNVTTYSYADNFFDDNGANPAQPHSTSTPTNAYVTKVTPAGGSSLATTLGYYWGTGQLAKAMDANGNTSYLHFVDSLNRPTATALLDSSSVMRSWSLNSYAGSGQVYTYTGTTDSNPSSSCSHCRADMNEFDLLGRTNVHEILNDPDGPTLSMFDYDSNGRLQDEYNSYRSLSDSTYGKNTNRYDSLDRTLHVDEADGNYVSIYYGAAINALGQTTQQCLPTSAYGLGYPALYVDEAWNESETWTDGFGRVIETDEPNSSGALTAYTCYTYDLNNNLTSVKATGGTQTRSYTYDMLSRVTSKSEPERGTTCFYYTTSGGTCGNPVTGTLCSGDPTAVCRRVDARSITTTYAYDTMNRLTQKSYNDSNPTTPTVSYSYDQTTYNGLTITNGKGKRTGMSDGSGQTSWSYDSVGNVLAEARTINGQTKTIDYTYNLDSSINTIQYPGARTVTYTEGNAQRMTAVQDTANSINYATSATYAPQGALASVQNGSSLVSTMFYNNRLELCRISVKNTGTAPSNCTSATTGNVFDLAYSYVSGNNGNIATQTNNDTSGRTQSYTYDPLNRLLTAQAAATSGRDCWGQSFGNGIPPPTMATDAVANLFYTSSIKCSSPAPQYTMNTSNNNQFTGTGIGYDLDGDMTADTAYNYTYDAENRVRSAAVGGTYYCYIYDGNGLRVEKATASSSACSSPTAYELYWRNVAGNTIAETDGSGSTINANYHEYIFFAGRRIAQSNPNATPASVYYYFADHLGSTRVVTTAAGSQCYEADFLPYGTENTPDGFTNTCSTNYKFTGYERDSETAAGTSSGNDYAFARYYNSRLGRFMSADPLDGDITDPQTLNHYAYVRNNPINGVDPRGLCKLNTFEDTGFDFCAWALVQAWNGGFDCWNCFVVGPPPPPKPPSQVKPPAPKPQKKLCFTPNILQRLGIAAQAWLAKKSGLNIGFGAGGSAAAGKIAFGWLYSASQMMVVSPNGQAALVTTFGQANVGPIPGLVHGVGALGGLQFSIGAPTTSPDELSGNSLDAGGGGGEDFGVMGDFSVSANANWQATITGGPAEGGFGHGLTVQSSSVIPVCKK